MDIQIVFGDFNSTNCEAIAVSPAGREALGDVVGRIMTDVNPTSALIRKSQIEYFADCLKARGAIVEVSFSSEVSS